MIPREELERIVAMITSAIKKAHRDLIPDVVRELKALMPATSDDDLEATVVHVLSTATLGLGAAMVTELNLDPIALTRSAQLAAIKHSTQS